MHPTLLCMISVLDIMLALCMLIKFDKYLFRWISCSIIISFCSRSRNLFVVIFMITCILILIMIIVFIITFVLVLLTFVTIVIVFMIFVMMTTMNVNPLNVTRKWDSATKMTKVIMSKNKHKEWMIDQHKSLKNSSNRGGKITKTTEKSKSQNIQITASTVVEYLRGDIRDAHVSDQWESQ